MKAYFRTLLFGSVLFFIGFSFCQKKGEPKRLLIFSGAAVKAPLDEILARYQKEKGERVDVVYSGSGFVLSQMRMSQTGDLYISGSSDFMKKAITQKAVFKDTVGHLAYLIPTINVSKGNPKNITSLADFTKKGVKVGIGNPKNVCIGLFAVGIFRHNQLYEKIKPNIVTYAESCAKVLSLLTLKLVDAVIGWNYFDQQSGGTVENIPFQPNEVPVISTASISLSLFTRQKERAVALRDYILAQKSIFMKRGFIIDLQNARKLAPNAKIDFDLN